jgi:four helix bundle protein
LRSIEPRSVSRGELFGLTAQLRRAAVSVPANIAEGSQRQYLREYLQFLYVAKASLSEAEYHLHLAKQLGYLAVEDFEPLAAVESETSKTLFGLIHWLEKQLATGKTTKKDLSDSKRAGSTE